MDSVIDEATGAYRDAPFYMMLIDFMEYAETMMRSLDLLFDGGCVRNLDEQIMGMNRSHDRLKQALSEHRSEDQEIPSLVLDEVEKRLKAIIGHRLEERYPAHFHRQHRAQIHEILQLFTSHRREAAKLAA